MYSIYSYNTMFLFAFLFLSYSIFHFINLQRYEQLILFSIYHRSHTTLTSAYYTLYVIYSTYRASHASHLIFVEIEFNMRNKNNWHWWVGAIGGSLYLLNIAIVYVIYIYNCNEYECMCIMRFIFHWYCCFHYYT